MACKIDLRNVVIDEANSQGVPPEIALAVAAKESNICHWAPSGAVLRGKAGEYGIFQLMPSTAQALGVDPEDVYDNIHGGVKYLRQLYDRFHDWPLAVQHYNGSGPMARAYSVAVMAIAQGYGFALQAARKTTAAGGSTPSLASLLPSGGLTGTLSVKNIAIAFSILGAGYIAYKIAS
ncbi:MAG: transglycosylase SLT domain-containing protein [Acidobacteriia bacterium]|nr:transglycosylase SLT domain-containing protein [Terriglobia bacterium]